MSTNLQMYRGQFAIVRKCKEIKTGALYAAKIMRKRRVARGVPAADIGSILLLNNCDTYIYINIYIYIYYNYIIYYYKSLHLLRCVTLRNSFSERGWSLGSLEASQHCVPVQGDRHGDNSGAAS